MNINSISIITCTLNSEKTLQNTLESVKYKQETNWEHIIVDGYSTDSTVEIINRYSVDKNNVRLLRKHPVGVYNALNYGIEVANKDWTMFLHSDDVLTMSLPDILRELENLQTCIACFRIKIISNKIERKYKNNIFRSIYAPPPHTGMVFRTKLLKEHIFQENYKISGDYHQLVSLWMRDPDLFVPIEKEITVMNSGGLSTKPQNLIQSFWEDYEVLKFHNVRFAFFIVCYKKLKKVTQFRISI